MLVHGIHHCTGHELRSWLLYYSVPVMTGIMASSYLTHYALLVAAIHILGGEQVSEEHLQLATDFLDRFYKQMQEFYGEFLRVYANLYTCR